MATRQEMIALIERKRKEEFIRSKMEEQTAAPTLPDTPKTESSLDNTPVDLLRGIGKGTTFGFGDEAAGVGSVIMDTAAGLANKANPEWGYPDDLSIGESYKEGREFARRDNAQAAKRSPIATTVGEMGGAIATGLATGGQSLAALGAEGAAFGLGGSEADLTEGEFGQAAKDTAIGAGTGVATGGLMKGASALGKKMFTKGAKKLSEKGAGRLLETTPVDRAKLIKSKAMDDLPSYLKEKGFRGNLDDLTSKVKDSMSEAGKTIGKVAKDYDMGFRKLAEKAKAEGNETAQKVYKMFDENIKKANAYDFDDIAKQLKKDVYDKIKGKPGYSTQTKQVGKYIKELKALKKVDSLSELNDVRRSVDDLIKWGKREPGIMDEIYLKVRSDISNHVKDKMLPNFDNSIFALKQAGVSDKVLMELGDNVTKLKAANREYFMGSKVKDLLRNAEGRSSNRRMMGLTDNNWTMGSMMGTVATGNPMMMLAPIAKKAADYIAPKASLYAPEMLEGATKMLGSKPIKSAIMQQSTEQLIPPKIKPSPVASPDQPKYDYKGTKYESSFGDDPKKNAVAHKVLMSQDEDYRKKYLKKED